jgi:hypothetical protein
MKKLIFGSLFLFASAIAIFSCSKDAPISTAATTQPELFTVFKFSKDINLRDAKGNTATVQVSADKQELIDQLDATTLKLVTTTRDFTTEKNTNNTIPSKGSNIAERWKAEGKDVVDILIKDRAFNKGVTGFNVEVVNNFRSWDKTMTQVGATNINGSNVSCKGYSFSWHSSLSPNRPNGKLCGSEIVEVEFAGRNNWWNFWDNIQTNDLNSATTVGRFNDIAPYDNYRLRWDFENCSSGDRPENRTFTFIMQ